MSNGKHTPHKVQVMADSGRWVAVEENEKITVYKDGSPVGKAVWKHDQMLDLSVPVPDKVVEQLEKLIAEQMKINWGED